MSNTDALTPSQQPVNSGGDAGREKWTVTLCSLAVFLTALEMTIISVAFPRIQDAFPGSTRAALSWIFTGYNVGVASLLLLGGWMAERFGRKRIFLTGIAVFGLGSIISGVAPNVATLLTGRVVQSVGGAMLMPSSLALILHSVRRDKRDSAIAVWGATAGLAAAVGPTVGAVLVQYAGWRWIFLLNVPIAIAASIKGRSILTDSINHDAPRTVDFLSVPFAAFGTGLLVLGIVASGAFALGDVRVFGALALSAVLLAVFVRRTTTHQSPLFPPSLMAEQSYRVGIAGTGLFGAAFAGWLILAPTFLVDVWGYSVFKAGFAIAPAPLAMAITAKPAGRLAGRLGYRRLIAVGCTLPIAAIAVWCLTITEQPAYASAFLPAAIIFGCGVGIGFPMLTAAGMRDVATSRYALAAAGNTTSRQIAMALGISVAISIVGTGGEATGSNLAGQLSAFQWSWIVCGGFFFAAGALIVLRYPATTGSMTIAPEPPSSVSTSPTQAILIPTGPTQ